MIAASAGVLGALPGWLTFAVLLLVSWRVTRGGGGSAVSELSKANEVLTARVHELGAEVRDLRVENAQLKERTDVTLALVPVVREIVGTITGAIEAHEQRGLSALENHEKRANERTGRLLTLLDLIAGKLGPEAATA